MCVEVFMRYVFHEPHGWVVEIGANYLVYMGFLGAAWLLKREGHVKLDILLTRLKAKNAALLNAVTSMIAAILCLIVGWYSGVLFGQLVDSGAVMDSSLETPKWILTWTMTVGFFLLFLQFIRRSYGYLKVWRVHKKK